MTDKMLDQPNWLPTWFVALQETTSSQIERVLIDLTKGNMFHTKVRIGPLEGAH